MSSSAYRLLSRESDDPFSNGHSPAELLPGRWAGLRAAIWALSLLVLAEVALAQTPVFVVGGIPPQQVRHNSVLTFIIQSPIPGAANFTHTLDPGYPPPQGAMTLNAVSGSFTYSPALSDKFDFRITFTCIIAGAQATTQSVIFRPIPNLIPEGDLVPRNGSIPNDASPDYLVVTQDQNTGTELFNGTQRVTWNIQITGKTVVIDGTTPLYGALHTRFHNRADVKNFFINAERLVVRSALRLPGANISVYAREVRFEDVTGQSAATLDTTPLGYLAPALQYQNGLHGQKGGDVTLRVASLYSQPGPSIRIITKGGEGQKGGEGRPGNKGTPTFTFPTPCCPITGYIPLTPVSDRPHSNLWVFFNEFPWLTGVAGPVIKSPVATEAACIAAFNNSITGPKQIWEQPYPHAIKIVVFNGQLGEQVWPGDGENAQAGGKPGNAGPAGKISSSLSQVAALASQSGGQGGGLPAAQNGGSPGDPQRAVWISWSRQLPLPAPNQNTRRWFYCASDDHTSRNGQPWTPSAADVPSGSVGTFTTLVGSDAKWLHPHMLRMVITHAKDAYRNGNLEYAKGVFEDYSAVLKEYGTFPVEFAPYFEQEREEMEAVLNRITNNLDFFNNSAGWVPLLSLEANISAFTQEVDSAIPLLYLSRWLQNRADQNIKDVVALQDGIAKLQSDIEKARTAVSAAANALPSLQFQASDIELKMDQLQTALEHKEAGLLMRAQENVEDRNRVPAWKKSLRIIGAVGQAVPAFQPALGAIGQGLQFAANFDTNQPLTSLRQLPNIYKSFKGTCPPNTHCSIGYGLQQSVWDWKGTLEAINPSRSDSWKEYTSELQLLYKRMEPHFTSIKREIDAKQIADGDVRAEFEKLKAESSEFNALIQQASDLQVQQQAFVQALADAMQTITAESARINDNMLTGDAMRRNVTSTATQFDHEMVLLVRDLEHRAKERLLKYQYYMAKSYEYRMLQPYPGDFNLDKVVDNILSAMSKGYPLSAADFNSIKGIYVASVREIVAKALEDSQRQSTERQVRLLFELTADELQRLNQNGSVTMDISSRIAGLPEEENRHIADIEIDNLTVQSSTPQGPVARVRAIVDHRGRSTQTLNGRSYNFYFGNGLTDRPFTWGASYDLLSGRLDQEKPSPAAIFLLKTLLQLPDTSDPSVLFARPGADRVVLTFRKEPQPIGLNALITKLRVSVKVDFFRRQSSLVTLVVQPSGILPYVALDRADVSGRTDGLGGFQRTYLNGQQVTLTAAPRLGRLKFLRWIDQLGNVLTRSSAVTVIAGSLGAVQPVYGPAEAGVGVFRGGTWFLDADSSTGWSGSPPDKGFAFGWAGATTVLGDWNGDGSTKVGVFSDGWWFLDYNGNGVWEGPDIDRSFGFGWAGVKPVLGDWNGDGKTKVGIFNEGSWFLDYNGNGSWDGATADRAFAFGWAGVKPVVGDWNGDGRTKVGIFNEGTWFLDQNGNTLWDGTTQDRAFNFGWSGVTPILGDWNGDGRTDVGVFNQGWWLLDYDGNTIWDGGTVDKLIGLGWQGVTPVVGDWNGDGRTKIGIFSGGWWWLDRNGSGTWNNTPLDLSFGWGVTGDVPTVGYWQDR
jgi:hypothetical protein